MQCKWQVEIDPFCQKVLAKHWPDVRRYGDVKDCGKHNLEAVDLVCGGFPCQPVSSAGKRRGDEDERWLWPEFYRIICELRPRWVLAENVPPLRSIKAGRLFGGILRDLADSGYHVEWDELPAAAFGAAHLRYRLFVVAYCRSEQWRLQSFGLPQCSDKAKFENDGKNRFVAHAEGQRWSEKGQHSERPAQRIASRREILADAMPERQNGWPSIFQATGPPGRLPVEGDNPWASEPSVCRMAYGVPRRVDRLRGLGNAVVPQIAEWIGRRIMGR